MKTFAINHPNEVRQRIDAGVEDFKLRSSPYGSETIWQKILNVLRNGFLTCDYLDLNDQLAQKLNFY